MKADVKATFSVLTAILCAFSLAACAGGQEPTIVSQEQQLTPVPSEQGEPKDSLPAKPAEKVFTNTLAGHKTELDDALDKISAHYGVLGYSAAAFEHDVILYRHSGGTASRQRGTEANVLTKYRVASISKVVTAMLAMTLVEQNKLGLDEDIAELLEEPLRNPTFFDEAITVEQLLTHTSSILDTSSYNYALSNPPYPPLKELLKSNVFSNIRPGKNCVYSNFGVGLVAGVVEQASGQYFYDYARDTLFEPMGIDAAFLTEYIKDKENIAAFYSEDPLDWGEMKQYYNRIEKGKMYLLGQGELYISAEDLARIAIILAGDGTYLEERYLTQESIDDMHTERARESETGIVRGLAVMISPDIIEGLTLYGHQGNAYGAISCVFYDPQSERGVVFLTNGASAQWEENRVYSVNDEVVKTIWKYL